MRHRRFDQRMALLYAIQHQSFQFQALQLLYGKLSNVGSQHHGLQRIHVANLPDWISARAAFMFFDFWTDDTWTSYKVTKLPQYLNMIDAFSLNPPS